MYELLLFLIGVSVGCIITQIIIRFKSGRGFFTISKVPEEEELYTVNVRLIRDQKLNKKKQIILTRE